MINVTYSTKNEVIRDERFRHSPTTSRSYAVEPHRRKIIQYVPFADGTDMEGRIITLMIPRGLALPSPFFSTGGHGTHVCGTIAGHCFAFDQEMERAECKHPTPTEHFQTMDGVAPLAKIAFFDIAYNIGGYALISLPRLQHNLFPTQYHAGARVSSNSWVGGSAMYGQLCYEVDAYLYDNPDFLVVMAAGNRGLMFPNLIASPAISKNGICVGATQIRGGTRYIISVVVF